MSIPINLCDYTKKVQTSKPFKRNKKPLTKALNLCIIGLLKGDLIMFFDHEKEANLDKY